MTYEKEGINSHQSYIVARIIVLPEMSQLLGKTNLFKVEVARSTSSVLPFLKTKEGITLIQSAIFVQITFLTFETPLLESKTYTTPKLQTLS